MSEEWRPVVGWAGLYAVSNRGRVRSLDRRYRAVTRWGGGGEFCKPGRELKLARDRQGYAYVALQRQGERRDRKVHILVAEAFIGPRPPGLVVRHLDCDNSNNAAANLAYGTPAQNVADSVRCGTRTGERCKRGHLLVAPNLTPGSATGGRRACRACRSATSAANHARRSGRPVPDRQAYADAKYAALMAY